MNCTWRLQIPRCQCFFITCIFPLWRVGIQPRCRTLSAWFATFLATDPRDRRLRSDSAGARSTAARNKSKKVDRWVGISWVFDITLFMKSWLRPLEIYQKLRSACSCLRPFWGCHDLKRQPSFHHPFFATNYIPSCSPPVICTFNNFFAKQYTDPIDSPLPATYVSCTNVDVFSLVFSRLPPQQRPSASGSVCSVLETVQVRPPRRSLAPREGGRQGGRQETPAVQSGEFCPRIGRTGANFATPPSPFPPLLPPRADPALRRHAYQYVYRAWKYGL